MAEYNAPTVTMPIVSLRDKQACPDCGVAADLHQPDIRLPDRLLMTCGCGCWMLLICRPEIDEILAVRLPDGFAVLDLAS